MSAGDTVRGSASLPRAYDPSIHRWQSSLTKIDGLPGKARQRRSGDHCALRPEPRGRMRCIESRPSGAEQFFAQRARLISCLVTPAPGQFRHQHVGDVFEIAGRNRKRHVQPVDVGLIEPCLDGVGGFFRRADHHRSDASNSNVLRDLTHGPDPIRIGAGDVVHRRASRVVFDMPHLLIEVVGREIDPGPAGHQGQRALGADMATVVLIFGFGLGVSAAKDHGEHREHQNLGSGCARLWRRVRECPRPAAR